MKILIVGLGSIGRRHLKNLAALGIRKFAVQTRGRCPLPSEDLPPFLPADTLEEALDWQPDAVFVCNPTALHLETALAAAKAGCHLFLEKPVSHSLGGLEELDLAATRRQLTVQVGFQFRFHGVFWHIKRVLADGHLGKIISAHAHWGEYLPAWHPWEDYRQSYSARDDLGGGVLLTLCHPFDYLRWLIGEVESVQAIGGHLSGLETDTEDVALVALRFEQGAIGSVYLDYVGRPARHTLHIVCEKGRIEWDAELGGAKIYADGGMTVDFVSAGPFFERNEMFRAEAAAFLDCLHQGRPADCTLNDGIRALEIALAAKKSLEKTALEMT
ncbi:MAG: Gfo/Idh/MocA family oxidoreductase [Saprospirales bacterium]|nr:Gfo/Idh/MocA family oxidoreductase [Saprospirales bacterium]